MSDAMGKTFPKDLTARAPRYACLLYAIILFLPSPLLYAGDAETTTNYVIDQENSFVWIYVYRAGFMNALGHDHLVSTSVLNGRLTYTPPPELGGSFKLSIPVDTLAVDDPKQRKLAGERFSGPVPDDAREGTRRNMLGEKVLDAARHPDIAVAGRWIEGWPARGTVALTIGIRDMQRKLTLPVAVEMQNDSLVVTGTFRLSQTALGITPLSILGGALKVADGLDIRYSLTFIPVNTADRSTPQ